MTNLFPFKGYQIALRSIGWAAASVGVLAFFGDPPRLSGAADKTVILAPPPRDIQTTSSDLQKPPKPLVIPSTPPTSLEPSTAIQRRKQRSFLRQPRPATAPSGGLEGYAVQLTGEIETTK